MFKKAFLLSIFCFSISYGEFINITPKQLDAKIKENITVIDIRTPPEWLETGVVPTSKKIMFFDERGSYDVKSWLNEFTKYVKDQNQPFVLVCRSGNRTSTVGNFLSSQLKYKYVYHLPDGIKSWIKENRTTIK